jgi:RNA recognition motif-containing protein
VEDSNQALTNTNGKTLDGRRLRVEKAKVNRTLFIAKLSQISNTQVRTLLFSSLKLSLTLKLQLREIVEKYGPVDNVCVIKNHQTNKSKGCGFVKYRFREDAMDAFSVRSLSLSSFSSLLSSLLSLLSSPLPPYLPFSFHLISLLPSLPHTHSLWCV